MEQIKIVLMFIKYLLSLTLLDLLTRIKIKSGTELMM